jgi:hypothetical protein
MNNTRSNVFESESTVHFSLAIRFVQSNPHLTTVDLNGTFNERLVQCWAYLNAEYGIRAGNFTLLRRSRGRRGGRT